MGNVQRDKESSLFHDVRCSGQAGVIPAALFEIPGAPKLCAAVNGELCPTLVICPHKTIAYSVSARKTCPIQITRYRSMAFKHIDTGALDFTPLKILIRANNVITRAPRRPGTTSGSMIKDTHETMTTSIPIM